MSTCLYGDDTVVTPIRTAAFKKESGLEEQRDRVRRFLAGASPTCRQLLYAAAVLGPRVDPEVLALMLDRTTVDLLPIWEEALAGELLICSGAELRFAGEPVRRTVAEHLPPVIRDAIRSQYDRLAAGEAEPGDACATRTEEREGSAVQVPGAVQAPGAVRVPGKVTPRERTVLEQVAEGRGNRQIARALGISDHAVKRHVSNLLIKFDCSNRTELALLAIQRGRQEQLDATA